MKQPPPRRKFELHNFNLIQRSCEIAKLHSKFFTVIGTPGIGKTVGLRHYVGLNPDTAKYVWVRETMTTKYFFQELAKVYGYSPYRGNNQFLTWLGQYHAIAKVKELLIIDEGGMLKKRQYSFIHELRDLTMDNLGILMSAPNYFLDKMKKWSDSGEDGIPEFRRRIDMVVPLDNLTQDEIMAVCQEYGIKSKKIVITKYLKTKTIGELIKKLENDLFFGNSLE